MILKIESAMLLSEIKEKFSASWPFLKLEFFNSPHEEAEPTSKKSMITSDLTVKDITKKPVDGYLETKPAMTVHELEMAFKDDFGLFVQVFRKSGNVWLETSTTDNMTLKEQNSLGKEKATPVEQTDITDFDYD